MLALHRPIAHRSAHADRIAQQRFDLDAARGLSSRRPVRRWIGRQLVRVGTRLAAEPVRLRPVRSA